MGRGRKIPKIFSRYPVIELEIPLHPEIDMVIDIVARVIYINRAADPDANVTRTIFRADPAPEKKPRRFFGKKRLR